MIQQFAQRLFANKFLLIATTSTAIIFIIILLLSPKKPPKSASLPSSDFSSEIGSGVLINLSEEKKKNANRYLDLISDRLPLYFPNFQTSVGVSTIINIYRDEKDQELTHLEITGLSYLNKDELDPTKNGNITAFSESFRKGLSLLQESGIDPKQLIIIHSNISYIQATASYWVDKLGLLR